MKKISNKKGNLKKDNKNKVIKIIIIIVIGIIGICTSYFLTKFQDVTIELGTKEILKEKFIRYGTSKGVSVNLSNVKMNEVGEYHISLKALLRNPHIPRRLAGYWKNSRRPERAPVLLHATWRAVLS